MPTSLFTNWGAIHTKPELRGQDSLDNLVEAEKEHTNHLPHCPATNLVFFKEQLELAHQALDFSNWVFEEVKEDDDHKVEPFQEVQD